MFKMTRNNLKMVPAVIFFLLATLLPPLAIAQSNFLIRKSMQTEKMDMVVGKCVILESRSPIDRISIGNPDIADLPEEDQLYSDYEIPVCAKKAGTTNITFWVDNQRPVNYDINVTYDISGLKQKIYQALPEEKDLVVMGTNDTITLTGKVSSNASLSHALAIARSFVPKEDKEDKENKDSKINNLVEVGGVHQVMLEVRVAELSKQDTKRLGINLFYVDGEGFGISMLKPLARLVELDDDNIGSKGPIGLFVSPAVNALFRITDGSATWTGLIDALKEDGLVKVLAEPTLIALSGQTASFLAGGEFPIPVPQGDGDITIDYKEFGVKLSFTPAVISNEKISLTVNPEVSELDFSTAVQFSGFVVPGLTTRRASTTIELGDGQSFAIAGLLQENISDSIAKFPFLGDIPIIGALFKSRSFQKQETELVIVVTPRLVKPVSGPDQLPLPTDYYNEPSNFQIFFGGGLEGKEPENVSTQNLEGEFGYVVPELE